MKILLTTILLIISCTCLKAQVQIGVMMRSVYTVIDTSKVWPGGTTLKSTSSHLKKIGYVVYTMESGVLKYTFLDNSRNRLDKKYLVSWDDRNSQLLQYKPLWMNPRDFDGKIGLTVDSVSLKRPQ